MIDTNVGNPKLIYENIINTFKLPISDIFNGNIQDLSNLNYQKEYLKEYDDLIRYYYNNIKNTPLSQTDYIIPSQGSLGAYYSVCWALKELMNKNNFEPLKIFHINKPPTYNVHSSISKMIPYCEYKVNGLNSNLDYQQNCDLGVIISPNNPTGEIINERFGKFQVIDAVYDTPIFTNSFKELNTKFSDNEIYLGSFSKLGVPSYRFGWAITNNPMIASKAWEYNKLHNLGMIIPSYKFCENLVYNIFDKNSYSYLADKSFQILLKRRREIYDLLSSKNIKNLNKDIYAPYILLPISQKYFQSIGVDTRPGEDFFISNQYSRINLMMASNDYTQMIKILKTNL